MTEQEIIDYKRKKSIADTQVVIVTLTMFNPKTKETHTIELPVPQTIYNYTEKKLSNWESSFSTTFEEHTRYAQNLKTLDSLKRDNTEKPIS